MSIDDNGPFDDPLFAALARHHGCHDRGSHWHRINLSPMHGERANDWGLADGKGIGTDDLAGLPSGMPRFRFARFNGQASLMIDAERYTYSNRGESRQMTIHGQTLPETLMTAATGRRLSEYVDLPGAADETIASLRDGSSVGVMGNSGGLVVTLE